MPCQDIVFLCEDASHDAVVKLINEEAFGPGRFVRAAERVREQGPHDSTLSFVAADHGEVIASVRMTPVFAGDHACHLLGPLAVRPSHKNRGIGRELVRIALAATKKTSSLAVLLVGDVSYYGPLGFLPTRPGALDMPGPFDPHRLLAACFGKLDAKAPDAEAPDAEALDAKAPDARTPDARALQGMIRHRNLG